MTIPNKNIIRYLKKAGVFGLVLLLLFFIFHFIFPLPAEVEYSTIITDDRDEVIHAYLTKDEKWRMKSELEEISPLLKKTILAKEDKYFYYHTGINPVAAGRAFFKNMISGKRTSGASTITMQVARMMRPAKRNGWNKLVESFRAVQLEIKYSKDEIFQLYLNRLPYGGNIEGVKTAALLYFNKSPDHLSLAEITALSIIPNRPSSLVMGKNNELIIRERNRWLQKFAADKVFTKSQIEDALEEPLLATRGEVPRYIPHLSYKLKKQTFSPLIKTNINLNNQLKIEKLVKDYVRNLRLMQIRNAAVVVIDNKSHKVTSYIGSGDFTDTLDGGQVNGAAAVRQPGSTLKPLLYALAMDEGMLTPKTVITDVPVSYQGYAPENYNREFNGFVTMQYALEHSLNIPAVKSLNQVGKDELVKKLVDCHFTQVKKDRYKLGLSMILGGCGTTLEELTALYSVFANHGQFISPAFTRNDITPEKKEIISAEATYLVNEMLSKVNRPDFPINWQATEHMPKIAWKTGTSYGRRDGWSIGYNKNYTIGVWTGNFSGEGAPGLSGAEIATPLLFKIFNTLDYQNDGEWFQMPDDLEVRQVCSASGKVPGPFCENRITDYFIPLISSNTPCEHIEEVFVSVDEKTAYCKSCVPETGYRKKMYTRLDADMQFYYSEKGMVYEKIPAHNPNCEKIFSNNAPLITSPSKGSEYFINKKNPEPIQLFAKTANDVSRIYWYINNRFYKSVPAAEKLFFVPGEGHVKISCTDDKGRNADIHIQVSHINF